jgi:hypothetical protein
MKRPARLAMQRCGGITAQGGKAAARAGLHGRGSVRVEKHSGHLPLYRSSEPQQGSGSGIKRNADAAQGNCGQRERSRYDEGREDGADVEGAHLVHLGGFAGLHVLAVQCPEQLPCCVEWLTRLSGGKIAYGALRQVDAQRDIGLREAGRGQIRDDLFPVHSLIISVLIRAVNHQADMPFLRTCKHQCSEAIG